MPGADEPRRGFVAQVDALCRSTNPKLASINGAVIRARDQARAGEASPSETFATFETLLRQASVVSDRFAARLRAISPPPAEADFHANLLASVRDGASNVTRQATAARRQDAGALRDLSLEGSRLNARSKGLLQGHGGFRFCGRG